MKRIFIAILLTLQFSVYSQDYKQFLSPPDEARPWIFWDWMNDLVTRKGITSDLEHFKSFGVRGTLVMLIGSETGNYPMWDKHNMPNPVISQTPEFFNIWKFAAEESSRLGLTITTQCGPGWCHSGGPWVKPEQAVQHIAYSETEAITGPILKATLVIDNQTIAKGKAYHSTITEKDQPQWVQIDLLKARQIDAVVLHPFKHDSIIGFGFPVQFKIETANKPDFSDKKTFYKTTADVVYPKTNSITIKELNSKGRYVRVTSTKNYSVFRNNKTQYLLSLAEVEVLSKGSNIAKFSPVTASSSIEKLDFTVNAITDNYNKYDRGINHVYTLQQPGLKYYTSDIAIVAFPDKTEVQSKEVIDLTLMQKDGKIMFNIPEGKWKIRRYAMRNALAYNRPAPIGGKGLECDKLDKDAVDAMFEGMVGRYLKDSPELAGKTIRGVEADSWEVGNPEWTAKFKEEFIKRRGYDPTPWLITYKTDQIVGSKDLTSRFQNDMYLTQTDLFADNFFTHMREKAESYGMDFITEAYMGPFDPIRCGGRSSIPTGEFWASGDFLNSVRWASSAAHTYDRKIVAAEAFTGRWNDGNWTMDLFALKRVGDLAFCNGVNKTVLHGTAHQPWGTDVKPGMPMLFWGTMFAPGQTWWEPGRAWTDYLSRCQYMLQNGKNVADVVGLMPNLNWIDAMPSGLHKSYNYDLVSEETFLGNMDFKDGSFILPSGAKYKVLFLPKTNGRMAPENISKLIELVKKGGTVVCQDKPSTSTGLTNYPQVDDQVKELTDVLWGNTNGDNILEHKLGNGKLVWLKDIWTDIMDSENAYFLKTRFKSKAFYGKPQSTTLWSSEFLKFLKSITLPDVEVLKASGIAMAWGGKEETVVGRRQGEDAIAWVHHKDGDADVYFVSSQVAGDNEAEILFRVKGKVPELWCAETGKKYRPKEWSVEGDRIKVTLPFNTFGSLFVIFKPQNAEQKTLAVYRSEKVIQTVPLDINWSVTFPEKYGAPASATMKAGSWTENSNTGIKYFSGTATYQSDITVSRELLQSSISLDLGEVKNFAEVIVNGKPVGVLWKPPYKLDISEYLQEGQNTLALKITNTWWNRMVGDEQYPSDLKWGEKVLYAGNDYKGYPLKEIPKWVWTGEQRPVKERITFSTWRFVEKDSPLQSAGLIGPVQLVVLAKP